MEAEETHTLRPEEKEVNESGVQSVGYILKGEKVFPVYSSEEVLKYLKKTNHGIPKARVEEMYEKQWRLNPDILLIHSFHPPTSPSEVNELEEHIQLLENLIDKY